MAADQTAVERNLTHIPDSRMEVIPSPKWVRVYFGGETIADSRRVLLLRKEGELPLYYFPQEDVRVDLLSPESSEGEARHWSIRAAGRTAENAAWSYPDPTGAAAVLKGSIAFKWGAMDAWYEEDEEVYVHARDPYKRIDMIHSSRHVRVILAGETVAETRRPVLLFEPPWPTRYYIPKMDVRLDLLVSSQTQTQCPYKGVASYYSVQVGDALIEDIAWYYPYPVPEAGKIQNLVCFFNERVDALYVDGELMPKPNTRWSQLSSLRTDLA